MVISFSFHIYYNCIALQSESDPKMIDSAYLNDNAVNAQTLCIIIRPKTVYGLKYHSYYGNIIDHYSWANCIMESG